ncbi:Neural cell adhesion molecule 1 [Nymphon striatum]|nr:Neural cell adhesion molecule 1 [Nymphon striatum]
MYKFTVLVGPGSDKLDFYGDEEYKEEAITFKPTFITASTLTYVHEYDSISLNCSVDKLGGLALIWKLGQTMLTIDGRKFDNGISLSKYSENGYSILVNNVTKKYEGEYECLVSHKELTPQIHNVQILRPPMISKVPANGKASPIEGQATELVCSVSGNPMPNVTWSKNGKEVTEGIAGDNGERLKIKSMSAEDEGEYKCVASNKMMEDATEMFKLTMRFAPKVEVESEWVHSGEGVTTEITCTVHASKPLKRIAWIRKSGKEVKDAEVMIGNGSTHKLKLKIRKMTKNDFGDYTCFAENELGEDSKTTRISGLPDKVQIKSETEGQELDSYTLTWTVKSHSQIFQYNLKYRKSSSSSSHFEALTIPPTSASSAVLHSQSYTMTGLENDTKYDVIVTARNVFGWSEGSEAVYFLNNQW